MSTASIERTGYKRSVSSRIRQAPSECFREMRTDDKDKTAWSGHSQHPLLTSDNLVNHRVLGRLLAAGRSLTLFPSVVPGDCGTASLNVSMLLAMRVLSRAALASPASLLRCSASRRGASIASNLIASRTALRARVLNGFETRIS